MQALGSRTAASVREDEEAHELIAQTTGMTCPAVAGRLAMVSGNTLVRNVFGDCWPSSQERLLDIRVKFARDAGLFPEIASRTSLTEREVIRRLENAHGRTLVGNLFDGDWSWNAQGATGEEAADFDEDEDDEDEDEDEIDGEEDDGDADEEDDGDDDDEGDKAPSDSVARRRPRALSCDPDGAWSRPRALRRVIRALGIYVPERLRTTRFQEVVAALGKRGIEMRLAGEDHPLTIFHSSPGIGAKVRLRLLVSQEDEEFEEEEEDEEEDDVCEDDDGEDGEDEEGAEMAAEESSDRVSEPAVARRLRLDPGGAWSKTRGLPALLTALGLGVPQRLRTERFRVLVQELGRLGVEMRLAADLRVLTLDDESPGIGAPIQLRVAPTPSTAPAPMTPIVIVPGPRPSDQATSSRQESRYELAFSRLQFLTAVPTMERAYQSEWPGEFIAAAAQGLHLSEDERKHLAVISRQWERGNHSPFSAVGPIVRTAAHHDLPGLVSAFRRLNAHFPDAVEHVVSIVEEQFQRTFSRPLFGGPQVARPAPPPPAPQRVPPPAPVAASPNVPFTASSPSSSTNVRDLGALAGMFDD